MTASQRWALVPRGRCVASGLAAHLPCPGVALVISVVTIIGLHLCPKAGLSDHGFVSLCVETTQVVSPLTREPRGA